MTDLAETVREQVLDGVTYSYNIAAKNETMQQDLMLQVGQLNEIYKVIGELQECEILVKSKYLLKFDGEKDLEELVARSKAMNQKLKECIKMRAYWYQDVHDKETAKRTLDVFHHPELEEMPPEPLRNLAGLKDQENLITPASPNRSTSPTRNSPQAPVHTPRPSFEASMGTSTTKLFAEIKRKREEAEERKLVAEVFDLMQKKAFISDRYGMSMSNYYKLELILRVCERYH